MAIETIVRLYFDNYSIKYIGQRTSSVFTCRGCFILKSRSYAKTGNNRDNCVMPPSCVTRKFTVPQYNVAEMIVGYEDCFQASLFACL